MSASLSSRSLPDESPLLSQRSVAVDHGEISDWLRLRWFYPEDFELQRLVKTFSHTIAIGRSTRFVFTHHPRAQRDSIEERWEYAKREVALNRSLAGEIYLGVRTIRWDDDTPVWSDLIDREAIRRMEVPAIADEVVLELGLPGAVETLWEMFSKGQRVPVRRYQRLAQRVAMFHQSERDLGEHHFELEFRAHVARQNSYWREFFSAFARHESRALDPFCQRALQESIAFLFAFQREYIDLLEERARAGFVVKGHGELDMRHVVLQKDSSAAIGRRPRSNPQEYFDVLLEVATLVTELEARGARREASAFEAAYIRHYPQSWNEKIYRYYRVLASLQHAVRTDSLGEDPAEVHRQLFYSFDVAFSFPRASLVVFSAAEQQSAEALARSVAEYYPLRSIRIDVLGNRSARGELRQIELCTALDRARRSVSEGTTVFLVLSDEGRAERCEILSFQRRFSSPLLLIRINNRKTASEGDPSLYDIDAAWGDSGDAHLLDAFEIEDSLEMPDLALFALEEWRNRVRCSADSQIVEQSIPLAHKID